MSIALNDVVRDARPRNERPVVSVGPERLFVSTSRGSGSVPLFTGGSSTPATVTQIVVMLHGRLRDADAYLHSTQRALAASSLDASAVMLVVPQFLATADVEHHRSAGNCLHWEWTSWMGGLDAVGPAPLSSFDVLDALIDSYKDALPQLREIVVAGHSGGAQVAHRHAILSDAAARCNARGVNLRYVIANPSSYVYFDAWRPQRDGRVQVMDAQACPGFNDWKYGTEQLPRYAHGVDARTLEQRYVDHDVTYLLGTLDNDPAHPALDISCAAMMQGPQRLARGRAYYTYLRGRHPQLRHALYEVEGAAHSGDAMFVSHVGVRALFGAGARFVEAAAIAQAGATE
jgi:hypothetical protein